MPRYDRLIPDKESVRTYCIIPLSEREGNARALHVNAQVWKGTVKVHVREYFAPPHDHNDWRAGRGIAIAPENIEQIVNALQRAEKDVELDRFASGETDY